MATKKPVYGYTGSHSCELKNGYWYIYLKSTGKLTFTYAKKNLEVCVVGGGGGGKGSDGGAGGGGGKVTNGTGKTATAGTVF